MMHTSPAKIRRLFNTNLEISGLEQHGGLDMQFACGIDATILLDGKTYYWQLLGDDPPGGIETC